MRNGLMARLAEAAGRAVVYNSQDDASDDAVAAVGQHLRVA
jgi:hypothetical protein